MYRQFIAVILVFLLAGCASEEKAQQGTIGFVEGFLGGVAADEPRAALVGRDVLSAGGSAADAAVAVYFALSVTLPSSASLGGGGICVVHDDVGRTTETLDFLARTPAQVAPGAPRAVAIPGNPRGFFALYSRFGRLRWEQLLSPAENLARFGTPVSRAFANDLAQVEGALLAEPGTRRVFGHPNGRRVLGEGEMMAQVELASVIGQLRRAGPGEFYAGAMAGRFVEAANRAGGSLSVDDMRNYRPEWRETIRVPFGNLVAHFASPPAAGGVAAQMWRMLAGDDRYMDADAGERPHLLAETALRAFADRGQWMRADGNSAVAPGDLVSEDRIGRLMASYRPDSHVAADRLNPAPVNRLENPSGTSFIVIDPYGSAVACALTTNNLFGTGRFAPGTGILLAALPGPGGRGPTSLGPMMVMNEFVNNLYFAAAASGGVSAPTAIINVAARTLLGGETLDAAMAAKRIHHGGVPDIAFFEHGLDDAMQQALSARGHRTASTPVLGRVNAVHCGRGLPDYSGTCSIWADLRPRGYGLAASAD